MSAMFLICPGGACMWNVGDAGDIAYLLLRVVTLLSVALATVLVLLVAAAAAAAAVVFVSRHDVLFLLLLGKTDGQRMMYRTAIRCQGESESVGRGGARLMGRSGGGVITSRTVRPSRQSHGRPTGQPRLRHDE